MFLPDWTYAKKSKHCIAHFEFESQKLPTIPFCSIQMLEIAGLPTETINLKFTFNDFVFGFNKIPIQTLRFTLNSTLQFYLFCEP